MSAAQIPTSGDAVALEIDHPSLSWMNFDLPKLVKMAELQAEESVLVLGCSTGELVIKILQEASGGSHRRMVGVDGSRLAVQKSIQKLDDLNLLGDKKFLLGDPYNLDAIDGLHEASEGHGYATFDTIFARNTLPADSSQHTSILRHWTRYLTPTSGRMVVTLSPCIDETPYLAGVQAVVGDSEVLTGMSWMIEREWVQLEDDFRALAGTAGLVVEGMKRLGLQGAGTLEMGEEMEEGMRDAGYVGSKQVYLWDTLETSASALTESILDGLVGAESQVNFGEARRAQLEATFRIVPITARLAAILRMV